MIKKKYFLKILIIELENLSDDINELINECEDKHYNGKITNQVFIENLAALRNELFGVESFLNDVRKTGDKDYETFDNLFDGLIKTLENTINEKGLAHSIINLVEGKINKVKLYVES